MTAAVDTILIGSAKGVPAPGPLRDRLIYGIAEGMEMFWNSIERERQERRPE